MSTMDFLAIPIILDDYAPQILYATAGGALLITTLIFFFATGGAEAPIPYEVELPEACQPRWKEKAEILESPSTQIPNSNAIQCYCPANGRVLGRVNAATTEVIDKAIMNARLAQAKWAKTTFSQRRKVLKTMLKYVLDHQDQIAQVACLDSGKARVDASFGEVLVTAERLAWTIKHGEKALTTERRPTNLLMCYKHNEVRWEPLGVVAACVSWNYPFHNLIGPIISSLFTGNSIIVKASEQTAWSAQFFTQIAKGALAACGHSPDLVQSVSCWPSVAPHLTSHPSISHITFIGSRPVAHSVAASAAKSLTPVCVELGGKDAAIVLDDVSNMQKVASILMRGVFQSAGQNCIGIERVIAMPKAHEELLKILVPRIRALRVGNPIDDEESVDIGACISSSNFDNLERLIKDSVNRGAKMLLGGGHRYQHPKWPKGHFFSPTLLTNVTPDMPIAQIELFAPVFLLMKAKTLEEAIATANSSPYGLGCSVFGSSRANLERVTREVKVGMVSVNDFGAYYMCGLPFGGVRGSGYGRFGGEEGLRSLCNLKSVCKDRWGGIISTSIPPRLDYAAEVGEEDNAYAAPKRGSKEKAWEFVKGVVELGYSMSFPGKIKAVTKIIRNA